MTGLSLLALPSTELVGVHAVAQEVKMLFKFMENSQPMQFMVAYITVESVKIYKQ